MDNVPQLTRTSLKGWESWLAPQVRQVELVGEIPITADECAQLGKVIGLRVRTLGHSRALHTLRHDYPCALAAYLVAQGIYGYQGGDYWSEVVQVTGLKSSYTWQVGQTFEEILEDLDLPLFYDMRAEAHRYVSLILAHGGIPNYCLPDFFNNMLQPSVLRVQYADMSAVELIDEWQWRSSVQYFTDKPVLRFLAYGGQVAEDFVERCREMAWGYLDSGIVPDAEAVGLPERVVAAYRGWIAEQSADQVQRESADRWRLRKPQMLVDPWGEGVILDLPPQQVPATMVQADFAWQVTAGEEEYAISVRVRRTGFDLKTNAESLSLSQPAAMVQVSLLADGQVKRTWRYQVMSDERPLLAFDPERFTLLSWQHSLPARRLGLLYPAWSELQVEGPALLAPSAAEGSKAEGKANLLEELPRLPWGWADFCGQIWDLSHATRLTLLRDGETVLTVPLRPDESAQRPHLVGGQLLLPEAPTVHAPVYVGPPPCVRIPLRRSLSRAKPRDSGQALTGRRNPDEELARWRLTVRNKWPAVPELRTTMTLADLRSRLTIGEQHTDLPLSLRSLLGETPCGNFVVRLRGPLGRDAEFTLRIVPHLVICGHESLYLPDAQSGPQPVTLLFETSPGDCLEYHGEEGECRVQTVEQGQDHWEHEVEVIPDVTEVELTVVHPLGNLGAGPLPSGDPVRVPVHVPIHRLRWALVGEQMGSSQREWTGRIIKCPVDALLQTQSPFLLIRLPLREVDQVHLGLGLLDVDNTELQVTDLAPPTRDQRLWRFDLTAFLDTIRASRSPILRFELTIRNLPGRDDALRLPVLSLTRTLLVDNVELEPRRVGDGVVFELRWHEPTVLRNRHVRLWPLWRPWDPVFEQPIPDEAEGTWTLDFGEKPGFFRKTRFLRSGKYRVEFVVVDPWVAPIAPQWPPKGAPGTADVELISPDRQSQYLDARLQDKGQSFELFLERAFVYHDAGDPQKAQLDWQWCFQHLDEGTIPQILALAELAKTAGDPATQRALQLKMFAAGRIERLRRAHSQGEVSPEHFRRYLANLPRSGLLPKATCELLLTIENETVRLHALQQLIRRGDVLGVDTLLEWIGGATLSDADAIALLALNPNFAVECLQGQTEIPVARRLLDGLSRAVEEVVRVGDWVHCDVGWGRIERIENPRTHAEAKWIGGKRSHYRLHVTLRPDVSAEPITIDLASASARFLEPGRVFACTKCERFSTQRKGDLRLHFQEAHPVRSKKEAKRGTIKYRFEEERISLQLLEFTSEEPLDQLT